MVSSKWESCLRQDLSSGKEPGSTHRVLKCYLPLTQKICGASTAAPWSRPVRSHEVWHCRNETSQITEFFCLLPLHPSLQPCLSAGTTPAPLLSPRRLAHWNLSVRNQSHISFSTNKLEFPFLNKLRYQTMVRHYTTGAKCKNAKMPKKEKEIRSLESVFTHANLEMNQNWN